MTALPIYDGKITANRIGAFISNGLTFDVIRPGYCIQGTRRPSWTQIVYEGVPIFETKTQLSLEAAIEKFDDMWARTIGADKALAQKALAACVKSRLSKFQDGVTAEKPAPSVSQDGKGSGMTYLS